MQLRALLLFALVGCADGAAAPSPAPRFQLSCDSADTSTHSALFCVRTDTRDGDVRVLELDRLPVTSGSARVAAAPAGSFQTVCDATSTPNKADFRCLRLDTRTGDVVTLRLSELPTWPAP